MPDRRNLHYTWAATLSYSTCAYGATMIKDLEKSNFTNVLEGNILEDEVASDRFGSYSLL